MTTDTQTQELQSSETKIRISIEILLQARGHGSLIVADFEEATHEVAYRDVYNNVTVDEEEVNDALSDTEPVNHRLDDYLALEFDRRILSRSQSRLSKLQSPLSTTALLKSVSENVLVHTNKSLGLTFGHGISKWLFTWNWLECCHPRVSPIFQNLM